MSDDLRERLLAAAEAADCSAPPWVRGSKHTIEAAMPIIEAELQKRDRKLRVFEMNLSASNGALANRIADLTETNQLLEQTIEVLEGFSAHGGGFYVLAEIQNWWTDRGQPLLDNLKALKKEGTE